MLEFILIMLVAVLYGHRGGGYPRKGRYSLRPVRTSNQNVLSTLGANVAIVASYFGAADGAYRIVSLQTTWSLKNLTAGEGPIVVGYAHGDYTVGEIKEFIESATSINIGDKIAGEQANRLVRRVGVFSGVGTEETLNNGMPIKTRLNWAIPIGKTFNMFAYNDSGGTLTTGAVVEANGVGWVKDY